MNFLKKLNDKFIFYKTIIKTLIKIMFIFPEDIVLLHKMLISMNKNQDVPWLNYKALRWLESYLKPDMNVFEYGSGKSTIYFSKKVKSVVSIEHNKIFYQIWKERIEKEGLKNINYVLIEPEKGVKNSELFSSKFSKEFEDLSFEKYVKYIEKFPDKYFDFILIDGRARCGCLKYAIKKLKDNGVIMLDNSERSRYLECSKKFLKEFKKKDFYGIGPNEISPWRTSVFFRKKEVL